MQEGQSLDQLLNDEPVEDVETDTVETEPTPEVEPQEADGPERDDKGRFAAKGVEDDTVPPTDKLPKEDYKAIREEREKRQNLERELEQLKQQFQAQQKPQEDEAPPPTIWDDEQGWQQHFGSQVVGQATYLSKLQTSEIIARQSHEDFGDVWEPMNAFLSENPALAQKVAADAHPWGAAYKAFKNHQQIQELGATSIDELRAKIREELMAEQAAKPAQQDLPPTLANERNVGSRTGPEWSGPKSLDQLLG